MSQPDDRGAPLRPDDTPPTTLNAPLDTKLIPVPGVPERVGSFKITRKIDGGGMGVVYEAMQESPRRIVAVKVMRRGLASPAAARRFASEAELMGRLRHPAIAQVYEAGTCEIDGEPTPYFAMEYVPGGRTLTQFARQANLTARERLRLFAQVCDAVNHGHQRGVVHCDLKPGNILVDQEGAPKIIDFGVARATDADTAEASVTAHFGQIAGTIQYMSPEQCDADPSDLDARSDVYALGVILYELLTGRLPYDVSKAALHEATRVIKQQPPARPSTVERTVQGDAEVILLKALEKDRDRRFQSAQELATDLRRLLSDEPLVFAQPPSLVYQLRKFAKRHRQAVSAAGVLLVVLVASAIVSTVYAVRADRARAKAALIADFFVEDVLTSMDVLAGVAVGEGGPRGPDDVRPELLEAMADAAEGKLASEPRLLARVQQQVGMLQYGLARYDLAARRLGAAIRLREADRRTPPSDLAEALLWAANAGVRTGGVGERPKAFERYERAIELYEASVGPESIECLRAVRDLASALALTGDADAAADWRGVGLDRLAGMTSPDALTLRADLLRHEGARLMNASPPQLDKAKAAFDEAEAAIDQLTGPVRPSIIFIKREQAQLGLLSGDVEAAMDAAEASVDLALTFFGPGHTQAAASLLIRSDVLSRAGEFEPAARDAWEAWLIYKAGYDRGGERGSIAATAISRYGQVCRQAGRWSDAEAAFAESAVLREADLGASHTSVLSSMYLRLECLLKLGRYDECLALCADLGSRLAAADGAPPRLADAIERACAQVASVASRADE